MKIYSLLKKTNVIVNFLLCLLFFSFTAFANNGSPTKPTGLSLLVTRVVYHEEDQKGVTLTFFNKSEDKYLLQSVFKPVDMATGNAIMDPDKNYKSSFLITPPITEFYKFSQAVLKIRRIDSVSLPQDRESVFYISLKAIPILNDDTSGAQDVVLSTVTNIKLFYRPKGLEKEAVEKAIKKLTFSIKNGQLEVTNPTPYWIVFKTLSVDQQSATNEQLRMMVPPLSSQSYAFSGLKAGQKVSWSAIDEYSWITPEESITLK